MAESTRNLNVTPEETETGKTMAIVAYLIFFVPLLMDDMKKNKFVMYHTEQGAALFAFNVIITIVAMITCGVGSLLYIASLVFLIMGIMNASNGKMVPLPVIGQFGEKFNFVK